MNGLVRNDFLDCMMEVRHACKDEPQGDVQSAGNANISATCSKLQLNFITEVQKTLDNIVLSLCCPAAFCSPDFFYCTIMRQPSKLHLFANFLPNKMIQPSITTPPPLYFQLSYHTISFLQVKK